MNTLPTLEELLHDNPGWLDEAVDTPGASQITGTPVPTLETLRCRGGGPRFIKRGARVSYTRRSCFEWLKAKEHASTSDFAAKATS